MESKFSNKIIDGPKIKFWENESCEAYNNDNIIGAKNVVGFGIKKVSLVKSLTKSKIINETTDDSVKDLASSLQPSIDKNSQIKYLD